MPSAVRVGASQAREDVRPLTKRQKLTVAESSKGEAPPSRRHSRIFAPYRVCVSNGIMDTITDKGRLLALFLLPMSHFARFLLAKPPSKSLPALGQVYRRTILDVDCNSSSSLDPKLHKLLLQRRHGRTKYWLHGVD